MSGRLHASLPWTLSLAVVGLGAAALVRAAAQDKSPESSVVMLTSQQDHDRQMQLLKISGFPPGPDAYQAATYDEAKATPYPTLPDPLIMLDQFAAVRRLHCDAQRIVVLKGRRHLGKRRGRNQFAAK